MKFLMRGTTKTSLYVRNFLIKNDYTILDFFIHKDSTILDSLIHKDSFEIICRNDTYPYMTFCYDEKNRFTYKITYNGHVDSVCDCLCARLNHFLILLQGL